MDIYAVPEMAVGDAYVPLKAKSGRDARAPVVVLMKCLAALSQPVAGSVSASQTIGPFVPDLGRPMWVTLGGVWTGTVTLMRSTDGGATMQGLTIGGQPWAVFSGPANEPVGEESVAGASYYLAVTLTGGTLKYRMEQ